MKRVVSVMCLLAAAIGGWLTGTPPTPPPGAPSRAAVPPPPPAVATVPPPVAQFMHDASPENAMRLRQRIERMSVDDVLMALEESAKDLTDMSSLEARTVRALADRLAELDVDAVGKALAKFPHFSRILAAAAGAALGAKDPSAAPRWASRLAIDWDIKSFWAAFGGAISPDTFATLDLLPQQKFPVRLSLAERLLQTDEGAAKALAHDDPHVLVALAPALARQYPAAALAWLDTFPKSERSVAARHSVYETWAAQDMPGALRAFAASGLAPQLRAHEWATALSRWPAPDVLATLEQSAELATTDESHAFGSTTLASSWFRSLATHAPAEATNLLARSQNSALHQRLVRSAASAWGELGAAALQPLAEAEPAAFHELLPHFEPAVRDALRPVIMAAWKKIDPAAAERAEAAPPAQ